MNRATLVLGGWGVSPAVLRPLFGENAIYIDSNRILPHLIHNTVLIDNWPLRVAELLQPSMGEEKTVLAGWSTGAMLAYAAASVQAPAGLLLLSATPSFCRTPTFKFGMRQSVLAAMRERLHEHPQNVLDEFRNRSGLTGSSEDVWSVDDLCAGLHFLEQASLDTMVSPDCPMHFIHGENDTIVPKAAGEYFSTKCHAPITLLSAPHACFTLYNDTINSLLSTFPEGTTHEPL